jgi:hypothetical protein
VFSSLFVALLICRPIAANWDPSIPRTCGNLNTAFYVIAAVNMVTDFMVMALPVPQIWALQLPIIQKLGLSLHFGLGLL